MAPPLPVAGPPGRFLVGHLLELRADFLGFLTATVRTYGDIALVQYGPRRVYLLSHPAAVEAVLVTHSRSFAKGYFYRFLHRLLGQGLLTSEGDVWRRQRRLLQPAFQRQRVAGYGATIVAATQQLLTDWQDGQVRDIHADMMALTLQIVCQALFDADVVHETPEVGRALLVALQAIDGLMNSPAFLLPDWVPTPGKVRLDRAVRQLDQFIYHLIAERRQRGEERADLLSLLLQARDEDGHSMTDQQLRDEAMTMVLAGHETTALALSWAWYLLAQHPAVAHRLHAEVDRVLAGRPPMVADLAHLPEAERVMLEALRLYPPIPAFGRETTTEVAIGEHVLPAGTNVMLSPWVVQRDGRFFAEPTAFRPERWADGLAKRLPRGAYFPFGGGPRLCIGQPFALLEAQLILVTIAQRYRLVRLPDHPVIPAASLTLRPKHGVRMRLVARRPGATDGPCRPASAAQVPG